MKKYILSIALVGFIFAAKAQFGYTEPVSNIEGSEYKFTKIAKLDATPVESQGQTGTCWSFSALSYFESELIRKGTANPELLSEMYIVRKAYEDKAEKFIRMDGKINFGEGGAFHDIPYIIKKYGVVPQQVYTGLLNGATSYDHTEMFNLLNASVNAVLESRTASGLSPQWKGVITNILDLYLGPDPKEFELNGKKYTPQSYAKAIGLNMDEYVSLTSFSNHEMYKECMLEIPDNWAWKSSYNVGVDELFEACDYALKNGYTLAWGADVSELGFSFKNGLAIVPEDPSTILVAGKDNKNFSDAGADKTSNAFKTPVKEVKVTQEMRQVGYDNKTTTDDHGMHIVGLYKDQNGTRYLLVKNSWGTSNYPKGFLYVSENYFKLKTINVYLHKDGIAPAMKKKLNL